MTNKIKASFINCYIENEVTIIGISDNPINPQNYLIISRFDDNNDIDNSIEIQTHLSEQKFSNVISKIIINKTTLNINIKPNKIKEVEFSNILVSFSSNKINYILLKQYINNIFYTSSVILLLED